MEINENYFVSVFGSLAYYVPVFSGSETMIYFVNMPVLQTQSLLM